MRSVSAPWGRASLDYTVADTFRESPIESHLPAGVYSVSAKAEAGVVSGSSAMLRVFSDRRAQRGFNAYLRTVQIACHIFWRASLFLLHRFFAHCSGKVGTTVDT